jgi:hypothetical protein
MAMHRLAEFLYGASRRGFPSTPLGRVPEQITELRNRILAHPKAVDEAARLLAARLD